MPLQMSPAPHSAAPASTSVLGVRVDRVTQQQALDAIEGWIAQRRMHTQEVACRQIVTVNPEFVMAAQHNAQFRQCINDAALVVADGSGIVWATRYLHAPAPERVTGVDMVAELARRCATSGARLYLLGAAPGVAQAAARELGQRYPAVQIAGTYAGSPAPSEEDDIIERIRQAQADIVCIAYGAPAQELWIYRNRARLPAAVAIGVGGAFDFLAGRQQRAPRWMQRMGVEWLYRLYREPWRWRRMLALPQFFVQVLVKGRTVQ